METKSFATLLHLEDVEIPILIEKKGRGNIEWVRYGELNNYPDFLLGLYENSADHQSIVDGLVQYTVGGGLKTTNPLLIKFFEQVNEDESIDDLYRKVALDYFIFGGFNLHLIPTKGGNISKIYWIDFQSIRVNEDENKVFYQDVWKRYSNDPKEYSNFDRSVNNKEQMFYFKGHKSRGVYPIPLYNGAIKSIATDIEIANFHHNNISKSFQVNTIINFNNGSPNKPQKEELERDIRKKFTGTSGNNLLLTFNESKEKETTVVKLDSDNFGEQYDSLAKSVQNKIFTAHKVTSPALFGIKMEGTGFSKTEYMESFNIFNQTVIRSHQEVIENELYKIFKVYFPTLKRSEIYTEAFKIDRTEEE